MSALLLTLEPVTPLVPVEALASSPEGNGDTVPGRSWPTDPETAYARLIEAVHESVDQGQPVPCVGPGADAWVSDEPEMQELAADRCMDCPLAEQCRAYGVAADERAGVWGGYVPEIQRTTKGGPTLVPLPEVRAGQIARRLERQRTRRKPDLRDRSNRPERKPTECTCQCGGHTRGGRYLPGHDSQHLARLVREVKSGALGRDGARAEVAHSVALQGKLLRFLGGR